MPFSIPTCTARSLAQSRKSARISYATSSRKRLWFRCCGSVENSAAPSMLARLRLSARRASRRSASSGIALARARHRATSPETAASPQRSSRMLASASACCWRGHTGVRPQALLCRTGDARPNPYCEISRNRDDRKRRKRDDAETAERNSGPRADDDGKPRHCG